jgi:hypothetical protein
VIGIVTERNGAAGEYEEVEIPGAPETEDGAARTVLRRRSAFPTRRAVLHVHCLPDSFVPEDVVRWYTDRGFHFYVADLRPRGAKERHGRLGRRPALRARFARLDAACQYLHEKDGIESVVISAYSADALAVALWCDARRDAEPADALILSSPVFGRRLRRGLHIACPVLVMCPSAEPSASVRRPDRGGRLRRRKGSETTVLGPHVTWLWLASGLTGQEVTSDADRKVLFDEMGRWLGAYMYGQVRDQLL